MKIIIKMVLMMIYINKYCFFANSLSKLTDIK